MSEPKRIQRKRTKGWRMPEGAIYVGRPTRWGNPFPVLEPPLYGARRAVDAYRGYVTDAPWFAEFQDEARHQLAGHDLACWCPLDQPCHADVLLEIANAGPTPPREGGLG